MTAGRVIQRRADVVSGDQFLDDEASSEASEPREFADITYGNTTHRIAFGVRDMQVGAVVYTAIPAARGTIEVGGAGKQVELTLTLPIDHALVKRYLQAGTPPKRITVTLWRKQMRSGLIERLWVGNVTSMSCEDDEEATFRIPSRAAEALLRVIPGVTAGRTCPHTLYDSMCQIDRNGVGPTGLAHTVTTTVMSVNGRSVRVSLADVGRNLDWAVGGEFFHVASGETMGIGGQADLIPGVSAVTDLTLEAPIAGMKVGDAIEVRAGCFRVIQTCSAKFGNRQNFGGPNRMPSKNVWSPQNTGFDEAGELL